MPIENTVPSFFPMSWFHALRVSHDARRQQSRVQTLMQNSLVEVTLARLLTEHKINLPALAKSCGGRMSVAMNREEDVLIVHVGFDAGKMLIEKIRPRKIVSEIVSHAHGLWTGDATFYLDDTVPLEIAIGDPMHTLGGTHHAILSPGPSMPSLIDKHLYHIGSKKSIQDPQIARAATDHHGLVVHFLRRDIHHS